MLEILLLCVSASLSGYEEWDEIVDFGVAKLAWLRRHLPFTVGIPAQGTLNRVMSRLEPRGFEKCLIAWVQRCVKLPEGAHICLDGKRQRRSGTAWQQQTPQAQGGMSAVHLLHAWCDEAGLYLGQYQTPDKANEITALPDLLALLDVQGCLLTMDAIGCQKSVTRAIAIAIAIAGAEYLLAMKGNQPTLHTAVEAAFATTADTEAATTNGEKPAHERVETRTVSATGVTTAETRHYLSSRQASATAFQGYVRRHWSIENRLHWVLDVVFGEDHSRKRIGHVAANCAIVRKFVLNLLRAQPESKRTCS